MKFSGKNRIKRIKFNLTELKELKTVFLSSFLSINSDVFRVKEKNTMTQCKKLYSCHRSRRMAGARVSHKRRKKIIRCTRVLYVQLFSFPVLSFSSILNLFLQGRIDVSCISAWSWYISFKLSTQNGREPFAESRLSRATIADNCEKIHCFFESRRSNFLDTDNLRIVKNDAAP